MTKEDFGLAVRAIGFKSIEAFCVAHRLDNKYIYANPIINDKALQVYELAKKVYDLECENKRLKELVVNLSLTRQ